MPRLATRVLPLVCTLLLGSCSPGGDAEEPKPIRGAPREVARTVSALDRATRRRDWTAICRDLFTPAARRRAGGADCAALLRSTGRGLRRPSIELVSIRVERDGAQARVRSRAAGQPALEDVILLRRQGGRYRIESLGG